MSKPITCTEICFGGERTTAINPGSIVFCSESSSSREPNVEPSTLVYLENDSTIIIKGDVIQFIKAWQKAIQ